MHWKDNACNGDLLERITCHKCCSAPREGKQKGSGAVATTEGLTDRVAAGVTIVMDGRRWKLSMDKKKEAFSAKRLIIAGDKASIDIDGEYDAFNLKIGCETNAQNQMKDAFKKYLLFDNCEKLDLSLLFFALINSAHNLLPKSTMEEKRLLVNGLRVIRNQDYGHIKECRMTSKKFDDVQSATIRFAKRCLPGSEEALYHGFMRIKVAKVSGCDQEDPRSRWEAEMSYKLERLCEQMENIVVVVDYNLLGKLTARIA